MHVINYVTCILQDAVYIYIYVYICIYIHMHIYTYAYIYAQLLAIDCCPPPLSQHFAHTILYTNKYILYSRIIIRYKCGQNGPFGAGASIGPTAVIVGDKKAHRGLARAGLQLAPQLTHSNTA